MTALVYALLALLPNELLSLSASKEQSQSMQYEAQDRTKASSQVS